VSNRLAAHSHCVMHHACSPQLHWCSWNIPSLHELALPCSPLYFIFLAYTTFSYLWAPCNATCSINRRSSTHPFILGTPETPIQLLMRHALISSNQSVHLSAKWHRHECQPPLLHRCLLGPSSPACQKTFIQHHAATEASQLASTALRQQRLPQRAPSFAAVCLSADSFTCLLS